VIHHVRDAAGAVGGYIVRDGAVLLDPPGIVTQPKAAAQ
jgi:hypothetical protein